MTFAYWSLVIAMFLPLVWVGVAKSSGSGYDNAQPRAWLLSLEGSGQRANWAEQNSYEAFPPFAAGIIVAHLAGAGQLTVDILAGVFLVARIAHGICYIKDKDRLRSLVWTIGFLVTIGLFVAGAWVS